MASLSVNPSPRDTWTNIGRAIIPFFARAEDERVTSAFQRSFEQILTDHQYLPPTELTHLLTQADRHIENRVKRKVEVIPPSDVAKLERYMLAVRLKWGIFAPNQSQQDLQHLVMAHNFSLYDKWVAKQHFSKKVFFYAPDLVDFVFKSHLHRYINFPAYGGGANGHSITWSQGDANLMVNGIPQVWSRLRHQLLIDKVSERIYSTENSKKLYWYYLQSGLIRHDHARFNPPVPLRRLVHEETPTSCQVQVVTTQDTRDKWGYLDHYLQGARHSYYRVILKRGFDLHPHAQQFLPGEVYSFGFRPYWDDFNPLSPLESYKGYMQNPDKDEFLPVDAYVTTLDVSDEQALNLLRISQNITNRNLSFNFVTNNCAGITAKALREANIVDLQIGSHMSTIWYELLVPKILRNGLKSINSCLATYTPPLLYNMELFL